ncbi:hypothetical protein V2J09_017256 [Rumex salicifolius]
MYASQFDGNAVFSGGGFMPSQATQSTESSSTPARVTIVGMVYDKEERVTDVGFVLDDGTGRLTVHRWVNEATDITETSRIENGKYVRVYGHLKGFQGKREMVAFSVRPIVDFNEITYHFTECMYVHSYNIKLQKAGNPTDGAGTSALNANQYRGNQPMPPPNQFQGQHSAPVFHGIEQKILAYIQQPSCLDRETGVHRDELAGQLNVPVEKLMESIKALEDEGLIYSTIDDCHFNFLGIGFEWKVVIN